MKFKKYNTPKIQQSINKVASNNTIIIALKQIYYFVIYIFLSSDVQKKD